MSQNQFLSEKFENVNVGNQMSQTCGPYESINSTQRALFRGVMAPYFLSLFFEHPVY